MTSSTARKETTLWISGCLAAVFFWILSWVACVVLVMSVGPYLFPEHYSWSWMQAFVFVLTARILVTPVRTSTSS